MSSEPNTNAGQDKKLVAWLNSQTPGLVNNKEKERMAAALKFDMENLRVFLGISVEDRFKMYDLNGYLYEGMKLEI